jgi:hypothetical protein
MTIQKMRELLGEKGEKMTDEEVLKIGETLRALAKLAIEKIWDMSPQELEELDKKIEKNSNTTTRKI